MDLRTLDFSSALCTVLNACYSRRRFVGGVKWHLQLVCVRDLKQK